MRKYFTFPLLTLFLLLSACSSNKMFVYGGEGSDWEAVYSYHETSNVSHDYEIRIMFKNDVNELNNLSKITIQFDGPVTSFGGDLLISPLIKGDKLIYSNSGSHKWLLHEDTKFKVSVKWGDNEESFVLEYKK